MLDYLKPTLRGVREVTKNPARWKKLTRGADGFDLSESLPADSKERVLYVAVPVNNPGQFDPFITLRFSSPESRQPLFMPFSAYFEGRKIYMNYTYKEHKGIPPIVPIEGFLRRAADKGYNPPLKPGDNVVVLRFLTNQETPKAWDVFAVGAVSMLKWM